MPYHDQLKHFEERNKMGREGPLAPAQSQNPNAGQGQAPGYSQDQPIDVEQSEPPSQLQQQRHSTQQILALVHGAARMAEEAASMARKAAEMAQQAANMAACATGMLSGRSATPGTQAMINTAPTYGSSGAQATPPQAPHQIDQSIESYQSQFAVSDGPKRKRKSRATGQESSGSGSRPGAVVAPSPVVRPPAPRDSPERVKAYHGRLMLLEQQNKQKLIDKEKKQQQQQQSGEGPGSGTG